MEKSNIYYEKAKQTILEELSKMSPTVISTAYMYAINYITYGVDVTEKWENVIQNTIALEKAYRKGYYDGIERVNRVSEKILEENER